MFYFGLASSLVVFCFLFTPDQELIAADLNLYSNPLNRALGRRSVTKTVKAETSKPNEIKKQDNPTTSKPNKDSISDEQSEDIIALDLNKYDSPMKELEKKYE